MEQGLGEGRFLVVCVCCLLEKPGDCDQQGMWMINTVRQNTMCMMTEVGSIVLGQWFSKHHPQINSISVRREVVKNANSTCQTWCIRHAEDRPRMQGGFNSPQEIL